MQINREIWNKTSLPDKLRQLAEQLIIIAHNMDRGRLYDVIDLEDLANAVKEALTE